MTTMFRFAPLAALLCGAAVLAQMPAARGPAFDLALEAARGAIDSCTARLQ